ncbi:MAG: DUF488 family protein [Alphaproteobacteria bacterium]
MARATVLTIGHSSHPLATFLGMLATAGASHVVDVRSVPASRRYPHFAGRRLAASLAACGIGYLWLGIELGGRPADPSLIAAGVPDYEAMARRPAFAEGLGHVARLARDARPALMCAEREPLACHRALLVARHLVARGLDVRHILGDGRLEDHAETERRLVAAVRHEMSDMFDTAAGSGLDGAYRLGVRRARLKRR